MVSLLLYCTRHIGRFERWFEARFGWFFTNGMKEDREPAPDPFKA